MISRLQAVWSVVVAKAFSLWRRFRSWKIWQQIATALGLIVVLYILLSLTSSPTVSTTDSLPTVTLAPVASLSSSGSGVDVIGTVRSESEADILAQASGSVQAVHTSLGASVPAGYVLAELENDSERAVVLQAEGSYDAAIAARSAKSLPDVQASAQDTYQSAYTTLDTVLENDIDVFFGSPTPYGPTFLINAAGDPVSFSHRRAALDPVMDAWRAKLSTADNQDPQDLLDEAYETTQTYSLFLTDIAAAANQRDSNVTADQIAALAAGRANVDGLLATLSAARSTYLTSSTGATASADASVKQALGTLNAAKANLEKTLVRAPIAGTVNFFSLHIGDYVTMLSHVATVAQNGALEIVAYVSGDERDLLTVGAKVPVEGEVMGIITSVSPALNPETKQIEVHIAVEDKNNLENGESVRITLINPTAIGTTTSAGPLMLPLTSLKLTPSARVVFSVGEDGRLIAHPVEIGDVRGDRIEIVTALPGDLRIVTDARGLSEGEKVSVATQ